MSARRRIALYLQDQPKRSRMLVELRLDAKVWIDCSQRSRRVDIAQFKRLIWGENNPRGFGALRHLFGRIKVPSLFDRSSQLKGELITGFEWFGRLERLE